MKITYRKTIALLNHSSAPVAGLLLMFALILSVSETKQTEIDPKYSTILNKIDNTKANVKLMKSLDKYYKVIIKRYNIDELDSYLNKLGIDKETSNKEIVEIMSDHMKSYTYKYDVYMSEFKDFESSKEGDCKDFMMAYALVFKHLEREIYLVVRDAYYDNYSKEKRVGHVFLGIPDYTKVDSVFYFEPTPPRLIDGKLNSFERAEPFITIADKKQVERLVRKLW